jgi:glycosyltransferase involved in cell wall biosynthesis
MLRIALVTPMLQPYRISFYEKLSACQPDLNWVIYHGVSRTEDGRPSYRGDTNFSNVGLKEYRFHIGPFKIVYNLGLYSSVRKYNPDLIILQAITGDISNRRILAWAKRKKKKIVLWACGWEPGLVSGILLSFKNYLVSRFYKKADFVLTYSTTATKYSVWMGVDPKKIVTCYNGIETDDLIQHEDEIAEKARQIVQKFELSGFITFLYVGGLITEKKVDLLIQAFIQLRSKYDNIKLLIIGDGPLRNQITSMIESQNDNSIMYLGRIIEDVDSYFAASDCLVLPGTGGLALNQAMFWRKTCIVSEADGTEDDLVIEGTSGFRFEKNSLESLISAMERRIQTPPLKITYLSENAHEIIVRKSNVNNMVNVFSNTVSLLLRNE